MTGEGEEDSTNPESKAENIRHDSGGEGGRKEDEPGRASRQTSVAPKDKKWDTVYCAREDFY
jgi:hypothetical protein